MDQKERSEIEELRRIADCMEKSRDGHGVARQHQRPKELADTLDWVREMNRNGVGIEEDSIRPADQGGATFPDCMARTSQGDVIGVELTGPGLRWDGWTANSFKEIVGQAIEAKSQKAKTHRRDGTIVAGLDKLVLVMTLNMEAPQVEGFLEECHRPDSSEFDDVYVMLDYKPDGAEGRHPVFSIKGTDVQHPGQSSRERSD